MLHSCCLPHGLHNLSKDYSSKKITMHSMHCSGSDLIEWSSIQYLTYFKRVKTHLTYLTCDKIPLLKCICGWKFKKSSPVTWCWWLNTPCLCIQCTYRQMTIVICTETVKSLILPDPIKGMFTHNNYKFASTHVQKHQYFAWSPNVII